MPGWTAGIDFTDAALYRPSQVLPDIIAAVNERCDAVRDAIYINRLFYVDDGTPNTSYSGAVTSIVINFGSDPGTFDTIGTLYFTEGTNYDEIKYTAVSGSGTSRTFTVSATLIGTYTTSARIDVIQVDPDHLYLYTLNDIISAIDSKINALIPYFADHTQATGTEFIDKTSIPTWSESSILTAIGASARIKGQLEITSEWLAQTYNIINKLLWVILRESANNTDPSYSYSNMIVVGSLGNDNSNLNAMKRILDEGDYQTIITNWPSGWSNYAIGSNTWYSRGEYGSSYDGRQLAWNWKYLTSAKFNHASELYLYSEAPLIGTDADVAQYDANGMNFVENKYKKFLSITSSATNTNTFDVQSQFTSAGAPPKPDITFYASYFGNPDTTYSGSITSITLVFDTDPGTFYSSGTINLDNGIDFDSFSYTAVSGSGTSRTFTVNTTLSGTYTTSAFADADSSVSREPSGIVWRGIHIGWYRTGTSGETDPVPPHVAILRFDVTNGFDYK